MYVYPWSISVCCDRSKRYSGISARLRIRNANDDANSPDDGKIDDISGKYSYPRRLWAVDADCIRVLSHVVSIDFGNYKIDNYEIVWFQNPLFDSGMNLLEMKKKKKIISQPRKKI